MRMWKINVIYCSNASDHRLSCQMLSSAPFLLHLLLFLLPLLLLLLLLLLTLHLLLLVLLLTLVHIQSLFRIRPNWQLVKSAMKLRWRVSSSCYFWRYWANLRPAKKAIMLSPLHTPVKVITFPLILNWTNIKSCTGEKYWMTKSSKLLKNTNAPMCNNQSFTKMDPPTPLRQHQ